MSIFFKHFGPYSKLQTANWPIAWRKQTQPYNKKLYWGPSGGVYDNYYDSLGLGTQEKCSFSILTRFTYEHWNIWTFCRYKRTIRFIRVFVFSESEWGSTYFINNIFCRRAFSEGCSGDVHRLWFLLSQQYQSSVLKIQQFVRVRSLLITLSFQNGEQRLK